jgi:hypothetical protein
MLLVFEADVADPLADEEFDVDDSEGEDDAEKSLKKSII